MSSQTEAKRKVTELIEKYEHIKSSGGLKKYNEEETKKDFIMPLFRALGWDIDNKQEVTAEEASGFSTRSDFGFYLNGWPKFFLEAKAMRADLHDEKFAKQAIRYSWNKGIAWAILTDFESLKVFNAQDIAENLAHKLFFEIKYTDYSERFDQLWLLSKESFIDNLLDLEAEKVGKKLQRVSVTEKLYKDLNECREILTKSLKTWNKGVTDELLDEGVQLLLDRLIFLRVAEDRKLEPPTLIPMLRAWGNTAKQSLYQSMIEKFRELDVIYNSNLFTPHPFEHWEEYDGATEKVIKVLYGEPGYYEYDFKLIPADILGSVYENYLGYQLALSDKGVAASKTARKRKDQGIYYTPTYIVDYIVTNALKPILDKCESVQDIKNVKVLDPACGSGSFLIQALEMINDKYKEFGDQGNETTKINILLENIYGVDLDEKAVEIARLNLLINTLETRIKLPDLSKNIKNGNSLISGSDEELEKYFGEGYRDKKPFNWVEEFDQVFNRENPGFDVIIGNPPYIQLSMEKDLPLGTKDYLLSKYGSSMGRLNTFGFFIKLGLLITRLNGSLGYIVPNTLLTQDYYEALRRDILELSRLKNITTFEELPFKDAVVENIVVMMQRSSGDSHVEQSIAKIYSFSGSLKPTLRNSISQNTFLSNKKLTFSISLDKKMDVLKKKITSNTTELGEIVHLNQAIALKHNRSKYITNLKVNDDYKPVIDGRNIQRYRINWPGTYLKYDPSAIHSSKNENIFLTKNKLFFRRVGENLVFAPDDKQFYALNTLVVVNMKSQQSLNIYYLLALLNSRLINFYYKRFLKSTKKVFSEIQARQVAELPIHIPTSEQERQLVSLTSRIINLQKEILSESENSNKWRSIKSEIEKTDDQIDQLVYVLYSLSPEEIEIIKK